MTNVADIENAVSNAAQVAGKAFLSVPLTRITDAALRDLARACGANPETVREATPADLVALYSVCRKKAISGPQIVARMAEKYGTGDGGSAIRVPSPPSAPHSTILDPAPLYTADDVRKAVAEAIAPISRQLTEAQNVAHALLEQSVSDAVAQAIANQVPTRLEVATPQASSVALGIVHETTPRIIRALGAGLHVYLYGPAGSGKTTTARYAFDSLADLAKYLEEAPKTWGRANSSVNNVPERDWDLNAGYEKSWELARYGWTEGARTAKQALKAFTPNQARPDTKTDFYGHMPHVARFCAGAPDCMVRHTRDGSNGMGRILTLIVPVNAPADVGAQYMSNFGLAVAQYVNQLETQGTRVEVYGALCSKVSGWRVSHTWLVKRAEQPLDLAVLSFAIGHPAMFRRLGFALRERCAAPRDFRYGHSQRFKVSDMLNAPRGAFVLNGMVTADQCARTPEAALAHVTNEIEKAIEARENER